MKLNPSFLIILYIFSSYSMFRRNTVIRLEKREIYSKICEEIAGKKVPTHRNKKSVKYVMEVLCQTNRFVPSEGHHS
jgi:hypothetical protein